MAESNMAAYAKVPAEAKLDVRSFTAHVDEEKLQHFKKLLELSPIAPPVFENTFAGRRYGITREWMLNAKRVWLDSFDWRKHEDRINSFPNFKASVKDGAGTTINVQFLALFSEKPDAVPLALFHGWPSSICEYLDILDLLRQRYSPQDLPYHIIVPSLPGYAYSSDLPPEADYSLPITAAAMDNLMIGLGFAGGYLAAGGDLGSFVCRMLAMISESCKGIHVNMQVMSRPGPDEPPLDEAETAALQRAFEVIDTGYAFAFEQGTRAATVGMALSSSPLALLSWLGEKFLEWTDEDPPLEKILEEVTLYWMTDTIPRSFYHNRGMGRPDEKPAIARVSAMSQLTPLGLPYIEKPCGYSLFANEIVPAPRSWAKRKCNLVHFQQHDRGGHFAVRLFPRLGFCSDRGYFADLEHAMEQPSELLADIEEYIKKVWKSK